jgi:hypothetical protein
VTDAVDIKVWIVSAVKFPMEGKVKVKLCLSTPGRHKGIRYLVPSVLNLDTKWRVSLKPRKTDPIKFSVS